MSLLPIGRLINADSKGVLPRIGRPPHPSWSPLLSDLIKQSQEKFTDSDFQSLCVVRWRVAHL